MVHIFHFLSQFSNHVDHVSVSDFTVSKIDFGLQISKSVLNCFWYQLLLVSTASEDQLNISLSGMREEQKVYSRLGLMGGGFSEIRTKKRRKS